MRVPLTSNMNHEDYKNLEDTISRIFFLRGLCGSAFFAKSVRVFFDDLRHCGIVNSRDTFYHAQSSKGTNLSQFSPYWGPKVVGVRCLQKIQ